VSVGSVYLAFDSKDAIIQALSEDRHGSVLRAMREALAAPAPLAERLSAAQKQRVRRARDVAVATAPPKGLSIRNVLPGAVAKIDADPATPFAEVFLDMPPGRLHARLTRAAVEDLGLEKGLKVYALIKSVSFDGRAG